MMEYLVDPARAAEFLPPGVEPDEEGRAAAIFGTWQSCSDDGRELMDPVRSQYMEFYVGLMCSVGGRRMVRCAFCWVDKDFSLVRGLIQGYPKKLGSIYATRSSTVGRGPRIAPGGRFVGTLAANDRRLAEIEVTLERPADSPPESLTAPLAHTRLMPAWAPDGGAVDELVTGGSYDQEVADIWEGSGTVSFHAAPDEELDRLAPTKLLRGFRLSFAESLDGGRLINGSDGGGAG
jgi:hypothetical protein